MFPNPLDPTHFTALHSTDAGSVFSADGREHPVTALTPVVVTTETGAPVGSPPVDHRPWNPLDPSTWYQGGVPGVPGLPSHFGVRFVVGLVAIGILFIVVFRLVK